MIIAQDAVERLELSEVVFIPASIPPHKKHLQQADATHRLTGERWLSTVPNVADHKLRVAFARAELTRQPSGDLASGLNHICQLAEQSNATAQQVIGAFVPTLIDHDAVDKVWSVRTTAIAMALMSASRLLRASTPEGHFLDNQGRDFSQLVAQNAAGKPLSLGERRALARRPSRATLDKLLRDPHPMVAQIVLRNPRITENDVVRMAAQRPARRAIVGEIAVAWTRHARVRMALVMNPGAPPAITVPLLMLLIRPQLAEVADAADLLPVVRATALELHSLRPPLPPVDSDVAH